MTGRRVVSSIRKIKPSGKLLDVGCATGDFLEAALPFYDVTGLELSSWAANIAESRGYTIHKKRLEDLKQPDEYDIVTLWGVIEHFENPQKEISEINRLLKTGGIVCLWTGDLDSTIARLLGKRWWYVQGQHIQLFTKGSLELLMQRSGFSTKQIGIYPYIMTLRSVSKSLQRYKILNALSRLLFDNALIGDFSITINLPGEMFAIFEKVKPLDECNSDL